MGNKIVPDFSACVAWAGETDYQSSLLALNPLFVCLLYALDKSLFSLFSFAYFAIGSFSARGKH